MCHFTLNGEMYIVGGGNSGDFLNQSPLGPLSTYQCLKINKIILDHPSNIPYRTRNYRIGKTEVEQLPDIPFEMQSGRCLNYDGESVIFTASWNKEIISK